MQYLEMSVDEQNQKEMLYTCISFNIIACKIKNRALKINKTKYIVL